MNLLFRPDNPLTPSNMQFSERNRSDVGWFYFQNLAYQTHIQQLKQSQPFMHKYGFASAMI